MSDLGLDQLLEILDTPDPPKTKKKSGDFPLAEFFGYPPPEQNGPLRWCEKEMRCASRGCGSSTFAKLQGVPYCWKHIMNKMNQMLIDLGVTQ